MSAQPDGSNGPRGIAGRISHEIYEINPTFFKFFGKLPVLAQKSIKIIIPFGTLALVSVAPLPLEASIKYALAIFLCISMLWTFGSLPLPVTALLVPVLLTFFGIFRTDEALLPFADPVIYLLMGGLIIAEAFRRNGIDRRLAYSIVARFGGNIGRTLLSLMIVAAVLSMWISNTATVALLIPVALGIASRAGEEKGRLGILFLLGIGIGSGVGGMATITGSAPNAIVSGLLAKEITWTFLDWMKIGIPTSMILLFLSWYVLMRIFPVKTISLDIALIREELRKMGPLKSGEKKTLAIFFPTIVLWVVGSDIGALLGFPPSFMSATIVALSAAFLLFLTKSLDWHDARTISWDIFLIIGAGLALGEGLQISGAADWMAGILVSVTGGFHVVIIMLIVILICVALSNFMSNTATVAILAPILIGMSGTLGIDPKLLVLACGFSASLSFITPIGTPPFTLIFSTGMISRKDLARGGLIVTMPAILIVAIIVYLLVVLGLV